MKNLYLILLLLILLILLVGVGERVREVSWPDIGNQYFHAHSDGDAGETTLLANTFSVINTSWTEKRDKRNCFTVSASENEVCYTCPHSIDVQVIVGMSVEGTSAAGLDHMIITLGQDLTGDIGDGDEAGFEQFHRDFSVTGQHAMGSMNLAMTLTTNQCLSVMAELDNVAGGAGYTYKAVAIDITEH